MNEELSEIVHVGYRPERCEYSSGDLERIFAWRWLERNEADQGIPLLVSLLDTERNTYSYSGISQRDAHVAATIVQWLGTSCGFGFLCETLRQAGYEVREKRTDREVLISF